MTSTVSFSTLTRTPARVLPLLDSGDVIVTRRNAPPLRLSLLTDQPVAPNDARPVGDPELSALASVLLGFVSGQQLLAALVACCPWMADLPPAVRRSVLTAISRTARAATPGDGVDSPPEQDTRQVLAHWRQRSAAFARS